MMSHRKKTHQSIVQTCSKFKEGNCRFQKEFCWFKHNVDTQENTAEYSKDTVDEEDEEINTKEKDSDFQEAMKKSKPPSVPRSQNSN